MCVLQGGFFFSSFFFFVPSTSFVRSFVKYIHSFIPMYILIPFIPLAFLTKNLFFRTLDHHKPFFFFITTYTNIDYPYLYPPTTTAAAAAAESSHFGSIHLRVTQSYPPPRILSSLSSLSNIPSFPDFLSSCYLLSPHPPPKKKLVNYLLGFHWPAIWPLTPLTSVSSLSNIPFLLTSCLRVTSFPPPKKKKKNTCKLLLGLWPAIWPLTPSNFGVLFWIFFIYMYIY